jgi:triacylglycerol lipase
MPPPDAEPFDINIAVEMARLSLQAYQQLADHFDNQAFTLPDPYHLQEAFFTSELFAGDLFNINEDVPIGFVATAHDTIYVVFRGTNTISEWIRNVTFPQTLYDFVNDSGRTHLGMTNVYQTIHEAVVATVNDLIGSGTYSTLYVTGHSLGGALAALAAPELRDRTTLEPIMYNFAAPRVGDLLFRQSYSALVRNSWRTVNTHDLVPTLPPTTLISFDVFPPQEVSYQHVFSENEITFGNSINDPLDVLNIGSNHDMCNYYSALCDQTDDPASCKTLAGGADGCNP